MDIIRKKVTPEPYEVFEYNGRSYQTLEQAEWARKMDVLTSDVYIVVDTRRGRITGDRIEVYSTMEKARRSLSALADKDASYFRIAKAPLDLREVDVSNELLVETHKKQIEKSQKIIDFLEKNSTYTESSL